MHDCLVCSYFSLCGRCLALFRAGGFAKRVCNVKHEFVKIYPLPDGSEDVAVKIVGGRVQVRKEWLGGLREKFGVKKAIVG